MKVKKRSAQATDNAQVSTAGLQPSTSHANSLHSGLALSAPPAMPWPRLLLAVLAVVAIFVADTTTHYEVAVSVFYAATLLAIEAYLSKRGLWVCTAGGLGLIVVSFALTAHGDLRAGLINLVISLCAIVTTAYLIGIMRAARLATQQAQSQLIRMARIHSLEGLTISIAHEINQPLAAIVTSANAGQRWLDQNPPNLPKMHETLARIAADAERASTIIARIRGLTRGEAPHQAAFDINAALEEIVALSKAELAVQDIVVSLQLDAALPAVFADRIQVQQVAANLLLNAIDALRCVAPARRQLHIESSLSGDRFVQISFTDTADGIASHIKDHLFDAFWTTKQDGIGVGLSLSRTIIEANGGRIWLDEQQPAQGARFHFLLPTAPIAAVA